MEEVLVWVMGDDKGTRALIGSFGTDGVIYRCDWADGEVDRGSYRTKFADWAPKDVYEITKRAEKNAYMIIPPTVLTVRMAPAAGSHLHDWVDEVIVPVIEGRIMALRFESSFVALMDEVS